MIYKGYTICDWQKSAMISGNYRAILANNDYDIDGKLLMHRNKAYNGQCYYLTSWGDVGDIDYELCELFVKHWCPSNKMFGTLENAKKIVDTFLSKIEKLEPFL